MKIPYAQNSTRRALDDKLRELLIDSRVGIHDRNQFEVKLDYAIDANRRHTRYRIDTYFFVPQSLGIRKRTYPPSQFYSDLQKYVRFKTPPLSLKAILEESNDSSPLTRLRPLLDALHLDPRDRANRRVLARELRMLGCLVRANLRDRVSSLLDYLDEVVGQVDERLSLVKEVEAKGRALIAELEEFNQRFRALKPELHVGVTSRRVAETFEAVDEYCSVAAETVFTLLLAALDGDDALRAESSALRRDLIRVVSSEQAYRNGLGLPSAVSADGPDERFVYRRGLLKKFVMSVLFLRVSTVEEGRRLSEVGAAFAAAVAMAFAVGAAFLAQQRWGLNTWPFFLAAVFAYVIKDRLKEWVRRLLKRGVTRVLWDHSLRIVDPESGATIGRCREAVSYVARAEVPPEVLRRRFDSGISGIEQRTKPEVVIKYEKAMRLDGRVIAAHHGRLHDINDILRFNLSEFLLRTDDPYTEERLYDAEMDAVRTVQCPKTYHLNILFVLQPDNGKHDVAEMRRVRVILDKRGIQRLEEA